MIYTWQTKFQACSSLRCGNLFPITLQLLFVLARNGFICKLTLPRVLQQYEFCHSKCTGCYFFQQHPIALILQAVVSRVITFFVQNIYEQLEDGSLLVM